MRGRGRRTEGGTRYVEDVEGRGKVWEHREGFRFDLLGIKGFEINHGYKVGGERLARGLGGPKPGLQRVKESLVSARCGQLMLGWDR